MPLELQDSGCNERDIISELQPVVVPRAFKDKWPGSHRQRSMEGIQRVFERNREEFGKLLREVRREQNRPCMGGHIQLALAISQDGTVVDAEVIRSSFRSPAMDLRLRAAAMSLAFGRVSEGGYFVVGYPLSFY